MTYKRILSLLLSLCMLLGLSPGVGAVTLSGASNAEKVWNYLKAQGYNDYGCAGILGNLYCESGFMPNNLQNSYEKSLGYSDETYTAAVDSGDYSADEFIRDEAGYGLAQWTFWSRKEALYNLAQSRGTSIGDLGTQLVMLHRELESYGLASELQNAASVLDASNMMLLRYEKPANQSEENQAYRATICQRYLETYGNAPVSLVDDIAFSTQTVGNTISVTYTVRIRAPGRFSVSLGVLKPDQSYDWLVKDKSLSLTTEYSETVSFTGQCGAEYRVDCRVDDGEVVTPAYAHPTPVDHSDTFTETAATCGQAGSRTGVCQYCGDVHTEVIQPTGQHTYQWVTVKEPAYLQAGKEEYRCTVCGKVKQTRSVPALTMPFTDVQSSDYYYQPVQWAVKGKITSGTAANLFDPNRACTRAEIVTFLWRAAGSPAPASGYNPFLDVKRDDWYYQAVLWAVEKQLTSGTSDATFTPQKACTRAEAATFLWRAKGQPATAANHKFTDIDDTGFYTGAVLWAVKKGITNGTSDTTFSPETACTRGQIVTFLYRAYN